MHYKSIKEEGKHDLDKHGAFVSKKVSDSDSISKTKLANQMPLNSRHRRKRYFRFHLQLNYETLKLSRLSVSEYRSIQSFKNCSREVSTENSCNMCRDGQTRPQSPSRSPLHRLSVSLEVVIIIYILHDC